MSASFNRTVLSILAACAVIICSVHASAMRQTVYAAGTRWTVERPETASDRVAIRGRMYVGKRQSPVEAARTALRATAPYLRIDDSDASDMPLVRKRKSLTATHLTFEPRSGDIPIDQGRVTVHIDDTGYVRLISARRQDFQGHRQPTFIRHRPDVVATAMKHIGVEGELRGAVTVRRVAYPATDKSVRAGWRVVIPAIKPLGDWDVLIDDRTLDIVETRDLIRYAAGRIGAGRVFIPNPVVKLRDPDLEDMNDSADAVPEQAYDTVNLLDLDGTGHLDGPYVTTAPTGPNRAFEPTLSFIYDRFDDRFEEVMAYYHIDAYQRYVQDTLGFDNLYNKRIPVAVNTIDDDNSYYSPSSGITLGSGGVDDGEDADIIIHEYGHAIQDAAEEGTGDSPEALAMGEGFSDYFAASYFADYDYTPTYIAEWDATSYTPANTRPAYLRRVDSSKMYPNDMIDEPHADGEIWSSALWSIRESLGQTPADRLVIESLFFLTPDTSFIEGRDAVLLADDQLNDGANAEIIKAAFAARGITIPEPIDGDVFMKDEDPDLAIPDNTAIATESAIRVPTEVSITGITVTVHITHTYVGDLQVWLRSPQGINVTLHNQTGGGDQNLYVTYGVDRLPDGPGSLSDFYGLGSRGTWTLRVRDNESEDTGTIDWWQLEIAPKSSHPPSITSTAVTTATEGHVYIYSATASDPDPDDVLTWSLDVAPEGMTIDTETGRIEWTPGYDDAGDHPVTVRVTDSTDLADTQSFILTVKDEPVQSKYDVNKDGSVDAADLQHIINSALGLPSEGIDADVSGDGTVNAVDVQMCINKILGV